MARDPNLVSYEVATTTCAWCNKTVEEDTPVFAIGGKLRPGTDLTRYEGQAIRMYLPLAQRFVIIAVTGRDSEAKRDGKDLVSMVCSETCGEALQSALQEEITLGKAIPGNEDQPGTSKEAGPATKA